MTENEAREHWMPLSLDLSDNRLGRKGCQAIADLLADPSVQLKELHLSGPVRTAALRKGGSASRLRREHRRACD